jgi:hypothetical protein
MLLEVLQLSVLPLKKMEPEPDDAMQIMFG